MRRPRKNRRKEPREDQPSNVRKKKRVARIRCTICQYGNNSKTCQRDNSKQNRGVRVAAKKRRRAAARGGRVVARGGRGSQDPKSGVGPSSSQTQVGL